MADLSKKHKRNDSSSSADDAPSTSKKANRNALNITTDVDFETLESMCDKNASDSTLFKYLNMSCAEQKKDHNIVGLTPIPDANGAKFSKLFKEMVDATCLEDVEAPSRLWNEEECLGNLSPVKKVHLLRPSTILEEDSSTTDSFKTALAGSADDSNSTIVSVDREVLQPPTKAVHDDEEVKRDDREIQNDADEQKSADDGHARVDDNDADDEVISNSAKQGSDINVTLLSSSHASRHPSAEDDNNVSTTTTAVVQDYTADSEELNSLDFNNTLEAVDYLLSQGHGFNESHNNEAQNKQQEHEPPAELNVPAPGNYLKNGDIIDISNDSDDSEDEITQSTRRNLRNTLRNTIRDGDLIVVDSSGSDSSNDHQSPDSSATPKTPIEDKFMASSKFKFDNLPNSMSIKDPNFFEVKMPPRKPFFTPISKTNAISKTPASSSGVLGSHNKRFDYVRSPIATYINKTAQTPSMTNIKLIANNEAMDQQQEIKSGTKRFERVKSPIATYINKTGQATSITDMKLNANNEEMNQHQEINELNNSGTVTANYVAKDLEEEINQFNNSVYLRNVLCDTLPDELLNLPPHNFPRVAYRMAKLCVCNDNRTPVTVPCGESLQKYIRPVFEAAVIRHERRVKLNEGDADAAAATDDATVETENKENIENNAEGEKGTSQERGRGRVVNSMAGLPEVPGDVSVYTIQDAQMM